jgi:hypothetical protein
MDYGYDTSKQSKFNRIYGERTLVKEHLKNAEV